MHSPTCASIVSGRVSATWRKGRASHPPACRPAPTAAHHLLQKNRAGFKLHSTEENRPGGAEENQEPELEGWQKSWVRQNPGRPLSEMPKEEPKFNPDNFGFLSIATGGVSFLVLFGTLWLANFASELRNMSPEELEARFGADITAEPSSSGTGSAITSAPSLKE